MSIGPSLFCMAPRKKTPANETPDEKRDRLRKACYQEGQLFETPRKGDPSRTFYHTLLEENSDSLMALKYCIEYGVLSPEAHKNIYKKYLDHGLKKGKAVGTRGTTPPKKVPAKKKAPAKKAPAKKAPAKKAPAKKAPAKKAPAKKAPAKKAPAKA